MQNFRLYGERYPTQQPTPTVRVVAVESKVIQSGKAAHSQTITADREAICAACECNVDWICEHSDCLPCQQRRSGGLRVMLADPRARCAAGKW